MKAIRNMLLVAVGLGAMTITFDGKASGIFGTTLIMIGAGIVLLGASLIIRQFVEFIRSINQDEHTKS